MLPSMRRLGIELSAVSVGGRKSGLTRVGAWVGVGYGCSHVRYWHLPRNAEMHLTLGGLCAPRKLVTLGHCSFRLFSKKGRLKSGRKKVRPLVILVWRC